MIQLSKRYALLIVALTFSCSLLSQVKFEKVYGSSGYDFGYAVAQMYDVGYAVVGTTTSFGSGSTDMYLLKTDSMGVAIRHRTFGGINIDQAHSVKTTSDSGLVIAGYTNSFGHGGYDMYIVKTDKNCDTMWTKTYGGSNWDFAYSIEPTSDGGYIIAGGTYSSGNGSEDMYLVKTNAMGDTLWTKTYGGVNDDEAKSVKQTSDGGYILTGYTKSFGDASGDIYTIKTNNLGDTLWTYKYQGLMEDFSNDILEDNTGNGYIIGGETRSMASGFQGLIIRLTTTGSLIASSSIYGGPTTNDGIKAITQTIDGRFATMGYTYSYGAGASDYAFYIEKPIGAFVGSRTMGGLKVDKGYSIKNTKDGGFIICGTALSYSSFEHIYLVKTDSLGIATGTVSNIVTQINTLTDPSSTNELIVFPNPANDIFALQIKTKIKTELTLTITDIMGRVVFSEPVETDSLSDPLLISTENFISGIYLINVTSENYSENKKLIIQKK